jgi:hypothetical protein
MTQTNTESGIHESPEVDFDSLKDAIAIVVTLRDAVKSF